MPLVVETGKGKKLQAGVEMTRQQDRARAEAIEGWIDALAITQNILPVDGVIFGRRAPLMHRPSTDLIEGCDDRRDRSRSQIDGRDAISSGF